ncbi:MAG: LPXTG cell wall anchor domain-containing protein [Nocardioidaceae bacterium]
MRSSGNFVRVATIAVAGLLTTLGLAFGAATAASAAPCTAGTYPPGQCQTIVLGQTVVSPGGSLNLAGTGFTAGETVTASFCGTGTVLGTTTADAQGDVSVTVTIPSDTHLGQRHVCLTGVAGERAVGMVTVVSSTSARGGGGLPQTGSTLLAPLAGTGVGLLLIGTLLLVAVRRRRHSASA